MPVKLVYTEEYEDEHQARMREQQLHGWTRAKKEALISGDIEKLKQLSKKKDLSWTCRRKAYEEFYVPGEKVDMQRFAALGVVCQTTRHEMAEVNGFFDKLEGIFQKEDFTKAQVVEAIKEFIPNFEHEEKGKNLDQKMWSRIWELENSCNDNEYENEKIIQPWRWP